MFYRKIYIFIKEFGYLCINMCLNLFKKRKKYYRTRDDWSFVLPQTPEERKKKLKALNNQRNYDKNVKKKDNREEVC